MKKIKKASPIVTHFENNYLYIKNLYERLESLIEGKTSKASHPDDATVYEYGGLYSLLSIKQPESQKRMEALCEKIIEKNDQQPSEECSIIHFDRNFHTFNFKVYSYGCGVCVLKPLGGVSDCFDINTDTRLKVRIYIDFCGAYLRAESDHGDVFYFELSEFGMLYREVEGPDTSMPCTEKGEPTKETGEGVFVVYDKSKGLSFTSEFDILNPSLDASMFNGEECEKAESTSANEEVSK